MVDLSAGRFAPNVPWVETDDVAIATLAAQHLRERGFKQFGYCGDPHFEWSRRRREAFHQLITQAGLPCFDFVAPPSADEMPALIKWLNGLPKPIGIFACYDVRGQQILDACRDLTLAVPEEVGVLGVNNDELLCELAFPPLSSVTPNARRAGYEAAALLDRMMKGERVPPDETRIPPLGICGRQSTDVLAVEDPNIAQALRFIREHACDPIDVNDVLRIVPLSRRVLEQRFAQLLNRTPHAEILSVRLNRAKQLISETKLSLGEIATRAGFEHPGGTSASRSSARRAFLPGNSARTSATNRTEK